jgi:hypothetical protein
LQCRRGWICVAQQLGSHPFLVVRVRCGRFCGVRGRDWIYDRCPGLCFVVRMGVGATLQPTKCFVTTFISDFMTILWTQIQNTEIRLFLLLF